MGFDPYNYPLKIQESIETPTPKMGVHLGVEGSLLHTLCTLGSMKYDPWVSFLARNLASFCLGLEPKARVVTQ
jgi:hypothetical protein